MYAYFFPTQKLKKVHYEFSNNIREIKQFR